ncbi:hypothetical protein FRC12_019324 [Ceratobasidium sp. 428]|nr:hypothetical protein FRC12_019324 [Ceratobasidium sp. 428]
MAMAVLNARELSEKMVDLHLKMDGIRTELNTIADRFCPWTYHLEDLEIALAKVTVRAQDLQEVLLPDHILNPVRDPVTPINQEKPSFDRPSNQGTPIPKVHNRLDASPRTPPRRSTEFSVYRERKQSVATTDTEPTNSSECDCSATPQPTDREGLTGVCGSATSSGSRGAGAVPSFDLSLNEPTPGVGELKSGGPEGAGGGTNGTGEVDGKGGSVVEGGVGDGEGDKGEGVEDAEGEEEVV